MKPAKQVLAVILIIALLISAIPITVFAENKVFPMDDAVEAIEANLQNEEEAEKEALEIREEQIKINTVEVTSGSNTGFVLENGKTYVFKKDVKFTNSTPSGSAITVPETATVTLQIEKGVTVTAIGADSETPLGAGAGIFVPESATLIIKGEGILKATGGNAANGENGSKGEKALFDKEARDGDGIMYAGNGGLGGAGGGGAGAGIGGTGGNGGLGGVGGLFKGYENGKYKYQYKELVSDITLVSKPEGESEKEQTRNLFDGFILSNCNVKKAGPISVVIRTSKAEKVVSYGFVAAKDSAGNDILPSDWVIYGSDDNMKWTAIATVKNPTASCSGISKETILKNTLNAYNYRIDKIGTYKYYRFDFNVTDSLQLNEIRLYREKADHDATATEPSTADCNGENGKKGNSGTRGTECGFIYILEQVSVIAVPGKSGVEGKAGSTGNNANDKGSGYSYYYYASGGGGGGGGAGGEAPKFGIGAGGDGGAGGGGGGAGSTRYSKNNDYDDEDYANGGAGGNGYSSSGHEGLKFGSQKGGNGGAGGKKLDPVASVSGIVCANYGPVIEGRLEGDIERGTFSINEDGTVVDLSGISVTDISGLTLENDKLYRFENNISYDAPEGQNAITIPDNSKIIFEIPKDIKVALKGGRANGINGAGAAIYVPESSTLIIRGSGVLVAAGGDAAPASKSNSGGGAGAGIGGKGGKGITKNTATPERGTDCGTVYILGSLKLFAYSGKASVSTDSYFGGKAADYGIGGGGAGGNAADTPVQLSGMNGEVFLDYASERITGRDSFYHRADLSVDIMGNVNASGYTDMILGNKFSDTVSTALLYNALREVANHNALEENVGWMVLDLSGQNGGETNDSCNGAYRKENEWNKDLIDISGGYVYLFTTYFGRYIKENFDGGTPKLDVVFANNPRAIVDSCWFEISKYAKLTGLYINDDMKTLMNEILYHEHYCEPFDGNRSSGYISGNPTGDRYGSKGAALQRIDYSYTSVLDCATARYATFAYDTERTPTDKKLGKSKYYYRIIKSSFKCVDGYKGVTTKNWMKYLPDNASVGQLNMPGTHDSGTYNVMFNYEALEVIFKNIDKIYKDNVPEWATAVALVGSIVGISILSFFELLAPLLALATVAAVYIACNWTKIVQYFIDALAQCNNLSLEQQMNAGIRTFDIRMVYNSDKNYKDINNANLKGNDKYYEAGFLKVCHGSLSKMGLDYSDHDVSLADGHNRDDTILTFKNVIEDSLAFVKKNPSESVYLTFKCEGSDKDGRYTAILPKVFAEAEKDPRVVVIENGGIMPKVGEAAGKVYLIERKYAEFREDHYDVSADKKIEYLKECFKESQSNNLRQFYDKATAIGDVRMIYSSTYDYSFNKGFLTDPINQKPLSGSPEQLARRVNNYLDTYGYQRGQRYGWIYMNFPTQMATSNLIFSNIFDMKKLVQEHNEGSLFTDFNGVVFFGLLAVFAVPVIAIPIVKKKKSKKANSTENEEAAKE